MTAPSSFGLDGTLEPAWVSVILATLNERENLPLLLDRLWSTGLPHLEVLVVDDGSTDGTREFLTEAAQKEPRLRLIWHDGKQTTVRAQCQGIAASKGSFVVVMDADLQHPPEVLPAMVDALAKGSALVVGSRYAKGGSAGPRDMVRGSISRGAQITAKLFLSEARPVTDPVSGLFAFRKEIFQPLPHDWRGYKLLLFLLVMARGRRVSEVGFRFEPRTSGSSKVTENTRFVRFFLTELILAKRFQRYRSREAVAGPTSSATAGSR